MRTEFIDTLIIGGGDLKRVVSLLRTDDRDSRDDHEKRDNTE